METPPIVVDLINGQFLRVGQDPNAREKLEQMLAAQQAVTAGTPGRPSSSK